MSEIANFIIFGGYSKYSSSAQFSGNRLRPDYRLGNSGSGWILGAGSAIFVTNNVTLNININGSTISLENNEDVRRQENFVTQLSLGFSFYFDKSNSQTFFSKLERPNYDIGYPGNL